MKLLLLLKEKKDFDSILELYVKNRPEKVDEILLILIHDAVLVQTRSLDGIKIFACSDDVKARGIDTQFETIDYSQIIKLMADCEKVVCW